MAKTKKPIAVEVITDPLLEVIEKSKVSNESALVIHGGLSSFLSQANEWRKKGMALVVTDIGETEKIKQAREGRLALRSIRVAADKKRKDLKEESKRYGDAVQAAYNFIEGVISPIETHLAEQEKFVERWEEQVNENIKQGRISELGEAIEYIPVSIQDLLGKMTAEDYCKVRDGARASFEAAAKRRLEESALQEAREKQRQAQLETQNERRDELAGAYHYLPAQYNPHQLYLLDPDVWHQAKAEAFAAKNKAEADAKEAAEKKQRDFEENQKRLSEQKRLLAIREDRMRQVGPFVSYGPEITVALETLSNEGFAEILKQKQDAWEEKRKENIRLAHEQKKRDQEAADQEALMNGADKPKMQALIDDLTDLKTKYTFTSKKHLKTATQVYELIDKIVAWAEPKI